MFTDHNRPRQASRRAPAKINLGLHVLRRRDDGFHDVETVMVAIGWYDVLSYREAATFRFSCSGADLPTDQRNLCVRAAYALAGAFRIEPRGELHLDKRIPYGAGLGGGSSDAAATLQLLQDTWGMTLPEDALHRLAAELGSDVPFFLHDQPMLAEGRGEVLSPLGQEKPYGFPHPLAVVMPDASVATAEAYALVKPDPSARLDLRELVLSNDPERWRRHLTNDFEEPILTRHPAIAAARRHLLHAGAVYVALSGSGAAVYGVFLTDAAARQAAASAPSNARASWAGRALSGGNRL